MATIMAAAIIQMHSPQQRHLLRDFLFLLSMVKYSFSPLKQVQSVINLKTSFRTSWDSNVNPEDVPFKASAGRLNI